jgi:hypothetical protein
MSTLYQNFNFNPVSTTTRTTDYIVPLGRYAYLTFGKINTPKQSSTSPTQSAIQVNGQAVFYSDITTSYSGLSSGTTILQLPATASGELSAFIITNFSSFSPYTGNFLQDGAAFRFFSSSAASTAIEFNKSATSSQLISASAAFNTFQTINGAFYLRQNNDISGLWVKSGDVITIPAGLFATITEYNQLG